MDRLQGVIAQAVYMTDQGVKQNIERTRALGEIVFKHCLPFPLFIWECTIRTIESRL